MQTDHHPFTILGRPRHNRWARHPGVRTGPQLTLGERAADRTRLVMGSWPFILIFLGLLAAWIIGNGRHGFDPYPFILLNLVLSCLAGLQASVLLVAARRSDQVAAELALHDYQTNQGAAVSIAALRSEVADLSSQLARVEALVKTRLPDAGQPAR
ncbi:DUF1003 domain-containing protein [Nonomuraea basaltis]|uniref:DUF1003 domain-containing protein n=1 Tax=Nonomuraea basaltis TaxID=2495887 RepID=UPI00110C5AB3|nr:DUF1003 domain-containing protein [Nonomuraea basaltis]TMR89021.1 DUF1003 domain-containing protein [Nonomuraea basaltis]